MVEVGGLARTDADAFGDEFAALLAPLHEAATPVEATPTERPEE